MRKGLIPMVFQSHMEVTIPANETAVMIGNGHAELMIILNLLRCGNPSVQLIIDDSSVDSWLRSFKSLQLDGEWLECAEAKEFEFGFTVLRLVRTISRKLKFTKPTDT